VKEDVADPLQFAGGHQRPAVKKLPYGYGTQQGVGFVGCAMASLGDCCSSSSNGGCGSCDTMGEKNVGFEGIGGHEDLPDESDESRLRDSESSLQNVSYVMSIVTRGCRDLQ